MSLPVRLTTIVDNQPISDKIMSCSWAFYFWQKVIRNLILNNLMNVLKHFIKKEIVLFVFFFVLVILAIIYPYQIINYPSFVDWRTIITLTGLLIITSGLKESGYINFFAEETLKKVKNERILSIFLILLSVLLSTFLTNDVTLFLIIPLTINLQNKMQKDISKIIIFEVIAVNVGSTLTPIGNPQNLFLWNIWNISFKTFCFKMIPLVSILLVVLLTFAWIVIPNKKIEIPEEDISKKTKKKNLFIISIIMLIIYVISIELNQEYFVLIAVFILYLVFYATILLKVDWFLLILFIIIFIDFHVISTLSIISEMINTLNLQSSAIIFLISVIASQIISNVPASVLISKFSNNWLAITYGVNIGGNGLIIGSLANIIGLRLIKSKKMLLDFHKYSIPYFLITGAIVYFLFFVF
ncbi:MAG: SLC13 family permease [Promethearchaeota archaeon]